MNSTPTMTRVSETPASSEAVASTGHRTARTWRYSIPPTIRMNSRAK
jgi:hypothetical protein